MFAAGVCHHSEHDVVVVGTDFGFKFDQRLALSRQRIVDVVALGRVVRIVEKHVDGLGPPPL